MLDLLPRPKASEDFTARTLSVATQQADGRIGLGRRRTWPAGSAWAWPGPLASALLFVVGYFLTSRVWPNPTARLARDLPIAESLDEYRDVGSFEFLQQLDESPEFN